MQRARFDFDVITDPVEPRPPTRPAPNPPAPTRSEPNTGETGQKPARQAAEPR